jgi:alcohol dehydrogenase
MKAAVIEMFGQPFHIQEVADPVPSADGVVIRVEATGICRSDWHGWMGHDRDIRLPHVPGHELAGVIEEVGGEVRRWRVGERVTVPFSVGCGSCLECVSGNQQICDDYFQPGFTAWGAFAQYVAIKYADSNLVRLPDELGFVEAASLGCRFATAFRGVVAQGRVSAGEHVVVHGCGGVGLSAIMIARALGAQTIGVDINSDALELALSVGAAYVVNAKTEDVLETIYRLTGGGAHLSVDALGSLTTCRNSILSLRKRGRHVQIGLMVEEEGNAAVPMGQVIWKELEILGSHGMQAHAYGALLDMIKMEILDPKRLVRKTVALEGAVDELMSMGEFRGVGVTVINEF